MSLELQTATLWEKSLVCLSDEQMAMQMAQMMEMSLEQPTVTPMEKSLAYSLAEQMVMQKVLRTESCSVQLMEKHLELPMA